jgi:hypothetical protein
MIPMGYPEYCLNCRNTTSYLTTLENTNNSSSNNVSLGRNMQEKERGFKLPAEAEPKVINQSGKRKVKKKLRCEVKSQSVRTRKKGDQNNNNQFECIIHSEIKAPTEVKVSTTRREKVKLITEEKDNMNHFEELKLTISNAMIIQTKAQMEILKEN